MHDDLVTFGRLVREARRRRRLSQEAVAAAAFGNPDRKSYVSAIENARRSNPQAATVRRIAEALDLPREKVPAALRWPPAWDADDPEKAAPASPGVAIDEAAIARVFNARLREGLGPTLATRYRAGLARGLEGLRHWTGPPFGPRSLAVSLTLSFLYVSLAGLVGFAADGPGIGAIRPFVRPGWAEGLPRWLLAAASVVLLGGASWACLRLLRAPRQDGPAIRALRLVAAGTVAGIACEAAGHLGADAMAIALVLAIACFAALSALRPMQAALGGLAGGVVAGICASLVDATASLGGLVENIMIGAAVGASAGIVSSLAAAPAPSRSAAMVCAAGAGVGVGVCAVAATLLLLGGAGEIDPLTVGLVASLWVALPIVNALTDWASLGVSHKLGMILCDRCRSLVSVLLVALADLAIAIVLAATTLRLIVVTLGVADGFLAVDLAPADLVRAAAVDPWGRGLWLTLMVLTTLGWTYGHFALVAAPAVAVSLTGMLVEGPLDRRLAMRQADGVIDLHGAALLRWRDAVFFVVWLTLAAVPPAALITWTSIPSKLFSLIVPT